MVVGSLDGKSLEELMQVQALERELERLESDVKTRLRKKREDILMRLDDSKEIA